MCTTYIYVYAYLYLNALIYCGVLRSYYTISCFACNYYDTSSPHNSMHSSSYGHIGSLLVVTSNVNANSKIEISLLEANLKFPKAGNKL